MSSIMSFITLFYILDVCWDFYKNKEDMFGGLLGAISPYIRTDGIPADIAMYNDWREYFKDSPATEDDMVKYAIGYVTHYGKIFEFDYRQVIDILKTRITPQIVHNCVLEARAKCDEHKYTI